MQLTTTDFRKNLFQTFDRVLNGEHIEIVHKGHTFRLTPTERSTKLSRLVKRDTLNCSPSDLEMHLRDQDEEIRRKWEDKWADRL